MTRKQVYFDLKFWVVVFAAITLVVVFNWISMTAAIFFACVLVFLIYRVISIRPSRVLGFLLLAACYEKPVLDFGIGIRGTIQLVDLLVVSLMMFMIVNSMTNKYKFDRSNNGNGKFLVSFVLIAFISALFVTLYSDEFDAKRKSIYYLIKLIEYCLALFAIQKIKFHEYEVEIYFKLFMLGLVFVAGVAILQGLGVLDNRYYTSVHDIETNIRDEWAISTLGPNHSHVGSYMALGIVLAMLFWQIKFNYKYFLAIPIFMMAIGFAHSAVGFAMVGLYIIFAFFTGHGRLRPIAAIFGVLGVVFVYVYMSGVIGEGAGRTAEKFSTSGEESEIILRSFVVPFLELEAAFQDLPWAIPFGFGFKVSNFTTPILPTTGDNNYFSVVMDMGLIGFVIYLLFLFSIYKKMKIASKRVKTNFSKIFNYHIFTWYRVILIAMFVQEILWPLHSRGSTMLIFLVILVLGAKSPYFATTQKIVAQQKNISGV